MRSEERRKHRDGNSMREVREIIIEKGRELESERLTNRERERVG